MARTALLGWEMGAGLGHAHKLKIVGNEMERQGWRVIYALRNPETAPIVGIDPAAVVASTRWPRKPPEFLEKQNRPRTSLTFGQNLGFNGYHDSDLIHDRILAWQAILDAVKPDLVVSDFSPTLNLACRGRVPLVVAGSGFLVPPADIERYPRLHDRASAPLFDELALAGNVNRALGRLGLPLIEALPEVMDGQERCVCTMAIFDPYDGMRREACIGTILEAMPELNEEPEDRLMVYLQKPALARPETVEMLLALPLPATLYIPGMDEAMRARFRDAGHEPLTGPADVTEVLPRVRAVISQGGIGLASTALLTGRPQLVLNTHIEELLTGEAIERSGLGFRLGMGRASLPHVAEPLRQVCFDEEMLRCAVTIARQHRDLYAKPAREILVEHCNALVS
ncbi:MAG: hypothetical protein LJE67_15960 [Salaquimonas sp.]|nr:hypothetical protein [Salaquimonas sp.]